MRFSTVPTIAVAILATSVAFAQTPQFDSQRRAEAALSNDTLRLTYKSPGTKVGVENSQAAADFFLSEERDIVLSGSLLFPTTLDLGRLKLLVGPRIYAALLQDENDDVFSATLGAEARFDLNRRNGLAVVGEAYYGPDILTFGASDGVTDFSARVQMRIAPRVLAFAGMRWFEIDLTEGGGDRTLQDEVFVGAGYRF